MTHSFLIVGGTREKRKNVAARHASPVVVPSYGTKFDTTILEPEEDSTSITIDQVRGLQHQLSLKPYAAECKTGIILEAQRLTIEAQNALLKTLEEPPAHSVLILTAPSVKNLLPTIVSRCQIVRLRAEIDLDLESEEYKKGVEEFLTLLRSGRPARLATRSVAGGGERLAWVEENKSAINNQQSTINNLNIWISVLRDLLLINSGCQALALNSFKPFRPFKPQILIEALERTIKTKSLIATTNVSPRLALEVLLFDLPVL